MSRTFIFSAVAAIGLLALGYAALRPEPLTTCENIFAKNDIARCDVTKGLPK
jgi:hypothetical protein